MTGDQQDLLLSETFKEKTILITGGAGYLGSSLVALLSGVECSILRLSRQETGRMLVAGAARIHDLVGDVSEPQVWEQCLNGVDFIFHLAAQTSTYVANSDPVADQAANVMPMLHMLDACRRSGMRPTVCFSSTVTVAGIPERLPVDETHPDHPLTMYDLHKQMSEMYLRWYAEQGVVKGITLRLANVYGPGPRSSRSDRGILNQMIRRSLAGEPLTVYGAGDQVRDYIYVEDAARAFIAAARNSEALNGQSFVIGCGQGHTIAEAMRMIAERGKAKTGVEVVVRHIEPPGTLSPIENRHFVADSRRFSEATGWRAGTTLAEGIDRTMEAFL